MNPKSDGCFFQLVQDDRAVASYAILTVLCLVCVALVFTLPETKSTNLIDSLILQADNRASSRAARYQTDEQTGSNVYPETDLNNDRDHWTCQENHVGLAQNQAISSIHLDVLRNQMTFGEGSDVTAYNSQSFNGMSNKNDDNAYSDLNAASGGQADRNEDSAVTGSVGAYANNDHADDATDNDGNEDGRDDSDNKAYKPEERETNVDDHDAMMGPRPEGTENMEQTAL